MVSHQQNYVQYVCRPPAKPGSNCIHALSADRASMEQTENGRTSRLICMLCIDIAPFYTRNKLSLTKRMYERLLKSTNYTDLKPQNFITNQINILSPVRRILFPNKDHRRRVAYHDSGLITFAGRVTDS